MQTVKNYLSLVKFSHTIFAMPFAMIGFTLGVMQPVAKTYTTTEIVVKLLLVLACMVTARSAAMGFNRYLDRSFDEKNPRTAIREIPKGIISPNNALRFVIINCLLFTTATFFINKMCFYLSPVALFVILFYSYTKRFTSLCHLVLGLGLSLAPIGAFLAVTGSWENSFIPVLLSFAVIFWVSGFDIIYAMQDVDFDQSQQLHSIPTALGKRSALNFSILLHILSAACVVVIGFFANVHWLYWIGVAVFTGMLVYQHSLVKPNDLRKVNIAFMTANGIASIVFAAFVIADLVMLS
ncbi:UbiA-like polyprenyltransferase [Haoranjiania flava]|uniref:4-hydroxybenzoate polyprenyltransferase n=1 Tax=Haoranjiania flava TaxID=1856322 RepID=A0AAE3IRJ2_9BACT|nr:UbiA-like polyprenyltransferase [Haoranjiania flava]MCU7695086.1 putative 4-hydroxybenzoate polyprenyltransferase [Haoranjiania flava]